MYTSFRTQVPCYQEQSAHLYIDPGMTFIHVDTHASMHATFTTLDPKINQRPRAYTRTHLFRTMGSMLSGGKRRMLAMFRSSACKRSASTRDSGLLCTVCICWSLHVLTCHVLTCHVLTCHVLTCHVLTCPRLHHGSGNRILHVSVCTHDNHMMIT
jgi:hypothetical protein